MRSSPDAATARDLLLSSLRLLEREHPPAHAAMCRCVIGLEVLLHLDGEDIALRFGIDTVVALEVSRAPSVRVATTRQTALDVVDQRLTILDALQSERLVVTGDIRALTRFDDALTAYLHGAVRCPSFPALLDRFRRISPAGDCQRT